MKLFFQILILVFAALGIYIIIRELIRICTQNTPKYSKIYLLCIPLTDNVEAIYTELSERYRRNGFGEDILLYNRNLSEESKKIGGLIETTDISFHLVNSVDLSKIINQSTIL